MSRTVDNLHSPARGGELPELNPVLPPLLEVAPFGPSHPMQASVSLRMPSSEHSGAGSAPVAGNFSVHLAPGMLRLFSEAERQKVIQALSRRADVAADAGDFRAVFRHLNNGSLSILFEQRGAADPSAQSLTGLECRLDENARATYIRIHHERQSAERITAAEFYEVLRNHF